MKSVLAACVLAVAAVPAAAQDFWKHWGDGQAEMNGYRLRQPRYRALRAGTAVLIFVTEDFDDARRVKHEGRAAPAAGSYPVLKLNYVKDFQTGVYDYNVMTSSFARVRDGWPIAKLSFSSQEWCGHVYHQLIPRDGRIFSTRHSYFQSEADAESSLEQPAAGVFGDAVPILIRSWKGEWLARGETRTLPFLPTLLQSRLEHRPLAWGRAAVTRSAAPRSVEVPAGRFEVDEWTVAIEGGGTTTWWVEAAAPWRIVGWSSDQGEKGELLGSARMPYWSLNGPEGEARLKEFGLR